MSFILFCFFFNDTATTEIYTLSLHDALPICMGGAAAGEVASSLALETVADRMLAPARGEGDTEGGEGNELTRFADRKSTRLNSSHANISYAVFCLKKKKNNNNKTRLSNSTLL